MSDDIPEEWVNLALLAIASKPGWTTERMAPAVGRALRAVAPLIQDAKLSAALEEVRRLCADREAAIQRARAEAFAEAAKVCDVVVEEYRSGKTKMDWTAHETARRIRALAERGSR